MYMFLYCDIYFFAVRDFVIYLCRSLFLYSGMFLSSCRSFVLPLISVILCFFLSPNHVCISSCSSFSL